MTEIGTIFCLNTSAIIIVISPPDDGDDICYVEPVYRQRIIHYIVH